MDCYTYEEINTSDNPILKNVDLTIILVMENSERFRPCDFILNLSKKTIIQYNKGFKACKKPDCITKVPADIIHAYYTAFSYCKNYDNVIILEEDAEILNNDLKHYKKIDSFIEKPFKILSFGTYGKFKKINDDFYEVKTVHGSQAQIYSKSIREEMQKDFIQNDFSGHIDVTYMNDRAIVYNIPLIVQKLPETENFNNWDGPKILHKLGIKTLNLDKKPEGWYILHLISKLREYTVQFLIILVLIISTIKYFH